MHSSDTTSMWAAGIRMGLATIRKEPLLGLKRLILPVSYWRRVEFGYVWRMLPCAPAGHVLDLGSPKDLAVFLARHKGCHVVATDILPEAITLSHRYAAAQGLAGDGPGMVTSEVQDGRALTYPDNSFDAAYSVSVLEHIPERGDSAAIAELVRVVKPGGVVVVTSPYDLTYRETFVQGPVYERRSGELNFFERHYDEGALADRLLRPSAAEVIDLELWGEGRVRGERLLNRLGPLRIPLSPLEPLLSAAFLQRVTPGSKVHPMAVFFTLRKAA